MLRPYQTECLESIRKNYLSNNRQQVVVMATGLGKTICFAHLPAQCQDILPGKMLVIAHRVELVDQAINKIQTYNPFLKVEKEMGQDLASVHADVVVASVQTLGRKNGKRVNRFDWSKFDKIVVDEVHHAAANSYQNLLESVGAFESNKLLIGFTATPNRSDGESLASIYKKIVYNYGIREGIEDGWLVDVKGYRAHTGTSLDKVKIVAGDFDLGQLSEAVNTPGRNQHIVKTWQQYGENRQTLVFCVDVQHSQDLAEMFRKNGVKSEAVWGADPERSYKLNNYANEQINVLCNVQVLVEGYDSWKTSCIIMARPTKSSVFFTQAIGRGSRLHEGYGNLKLVSPEADIKRDCLILDVLDTSSRHSLITLPTLLGMSAKLDLKGKSLVKSAKTLEDAQKEYSHVDFSGLEDISNIKSYIEKVDLFSIKIPPEAEANSELTWHHSGTGGFILLLPDKESVTIKNNLLDQWEVCATIKGKKYKGNRSTLEDAFECADNLIMDQAGDLLKLVKREQKWHKNPPSEAQIGLLSKLYRSKQLPSNLTKGQASALISQFLAGKQK